MAIKSTEFPISKLSTFLGDIFGLSSNVDGTVIKNGLITKNLTHKVKQHLKRLASKFEEEEKLYKKSLQEIIDKYKSTSEDDKIIIHEENKEQFTKEIEDLNSTEITIEHYKFEDDDLDFGKSTEVYELLDFIDPIE